MQADLWKAILRRLPEAHHDNLMVMTAQGTEINIQTVLCLEKDYMVLRGRLAGSSDAGRTFFVPYEHLDHMGLQRPLTDAQTQELFGVAPAARPAAAAPAAEPPAPAPVPAAVAPAAAPLPGTADAGLLARLPSKSKIIERLRLRTEARDGAGSAPKQ